MKTHPEVRLNRRAFSNDWEVVRVAKDGKIITDRWPLHKNDSDWLEEQYQAEQSLIGDDNES